MIDRDWGLERGGREALEMEMGVMREEGGRLDEGRERREGGSI
jgi:hypothetical protein